MLQFPKLAFRFVVSPDLMRHLTKFQVVIVAVGRHLEATSLRKKLLDADPALFSRFNPGAMSKLQANTHAIFNGDFPFLD